MGPGKYDAICTFARVATKAQAAVVIVFGGEHGDGFSVQAHGGVVPPAALADMLRQVAAQLDEAAAQGAV